MPVDLLWVVPAGLVIAGGLYLIFPLAWIGKRMWPASDLTVDDPSKLRQP